MNEEGMVADLVVIYLLLRYRNCSAVTRSKTVYTKVKSVGEMNFDNRFFSVFS